MIAALFVATGGCYFGLPDVDPYDEKRDARLYQGPHSVVAHPECSRWCQQARVNEARYGHKVGEDGGLFESALHAAHRFGGVLEHPALSIAWAAFNLPRPNPNGGWTLSGNHAGERWCWSCEVSQRNYGHRARKSTWLYAVLPIGVRPPEMIWGRGPAPEAWISTDRPRAELSARGIAQLSKKEAKATPPEFRDVLLNIARTAQARAA